MTHRAPFFAPPTCARWARSKSPASFARTPRIPICPSWLSATAASARLWKRFKLDATITPNEAVIYILKNRVNGNKGVYKFVYGTTSPQRTVLRSATDLMLDAMREVDESSRDMADKEAL